MDPSEHSPTQWVPSFTFGPGGPGPTDSSTLNSGDSASEWLFAHSPLTSSSSMPNPHWSTSSSGSHSFIQSSRQSIASTLSTLPSTLPSTPSDRLSVNSNLGGLPAFVPSTLPNPVQAQPVAEEKDGNKKKKTKDDNKFVCTHCDITFSKPTDQKDHFKKSCVSLGPGYKAFRCKTCGDISRTECQAKKHQKVAHQSSSPKSAYEKVGLNGRSCFSCCCPNQEVFTTMEAFHKHVGMKSSHCNLVGADQRKRICNLLEQGRGTSPGDHQGLYAAVHAYCISHHIPDGHWKLLVLRSTFNACELANSIEWGQTDSPTLLQGGLGFQSYEGTVDDIFRQLPLPVNQISHAIDHDHSVDPSRPDYSNEDLQSAPTRPVNQADADFDYTVILPSFELPLHQYNDTAIQHGMQPLDGVEMSDLINWSMDGVPALPLQQGIWNQTSFGPEPSCLPPDTQFDLHRDALHENVLAPAINPALLPDVNLANELQLGSEQQNVVCTDVQQSVMHPDQGAGPSRKRQRPISLYSGTHPDNTARGNRTAPFQGATRIMLDEFGSNGATMQPQTSNFPQPDIHNLYDRRYPAAVEQQASNVQRSSPARKRHGVILKPAASAD